MAIDGRDVHLDHGIHLNIAEAGAGGRPLLLVHGFTGAKEDFTEWLEPLAALGWHAVANDNRGHGASAKPDDEAHYTFDALATDVLALAAALWDDAPFVMLGHSMGGMVAQVTALRASDRLAALILMDTLPGPLPFITRENVDTAKHVVYEHGIDGLAAALKERGGDALGTPAHERVVQQRPGYQAFMDRKFAATAPAAYAGLLDAMFSSPDRLDELQAIPVPTLVITGEQDRPIVQPSHAMAAAIPGAALAVIPDAGHSPQFENAAAWWEALSTFLASVDARV